MITIEQTKPKKVEIVDVTLYYFNNFSVFYIFVEFTKKYINIKGVENKCFYFDFLEKTGYINNNVVFTNNTFEYLIDKKIFEIRKIPHSILLSILNSEYAIMEYY